MKVLVTGGAGFIGSHLVELLLQRNCEVIVLDNLHSGVREHVPDGVSLITADVRDKGIIDIFEKEQFAAVVHLAGQTTVGESVANPAFDASVNIQGSVNILECCRKTGVKRVVFAATAAAYGDCDILPLTEELVTEPLSFYGLSKLTVEKYLALYHKLYGLSYAALRFANVYGERQGDGGEGGVISIFTKKFSSDEPIKIFGDGGQTRDFIYVGDIANGIYQALIKPSANGVYNLSTNTEVSINEMTALLNKISGKGIVTSYEQPRDGDIYRSILSNKKAMTELNWRPVVALADGLARTYSYFARK